MCTKTSTVDSCFLPSGLGEPCRVLYKMRFHLAYSYFLRILNPPSPSGHVWGLVTSNCKRIHRQRIKPSSIFRARQFAEAQQANGVHNTCMQQTWYRNRPLLRNYRCGLCCLRLDYGSSSLTAGYVSQNSAVNTK